MSTDGWRVDPDGVAGVLADLDDAGSQFEKSRVQIEDAAFTGGDALAADGRTALTSAWSTFMEDRRLVPGKIMYAINAAAQAVSEATVAVVAGDEEMAGSLQTAERNAESEWGIAPERAYSATVGSTR